MEGPKEFIERLRREKFSVGAKSISPLAPELHQAIQQLLVELYQNDLHFVKEIIQVVLSQTKLDIVFFSAELLQTCQQFSEFSD